LSISAIRKIDIGDPGGEGSLEDGHKAFGAGNADQVRGTLTRPLCSLEAVLVVLPLKVVARLLLAKVVVAGLLLIILVVTGLLLVGLITNAVSISTESV